MAADSCTSARLARVLGTLLLSVAPVAGLHQQLGALERTHGQASFLAEAQALAVPAGRDVAEKTAIDTDGSSALATEQEYIDVNGRMCSICGRPRQETLENGKEYLHFRQDCGSSATLDGPSNESLYAPLVSFQKHKRLPVTNAFCELNLQKSCADAIVNQDYMYYAKSLDVRRDSAIQRYDGEYCLRNGFLEDDIVELVYSGDFAALSAKGRELCGTKLKDLGWETLTLHEMIQRTSLSRQRVYPEQHEAEFLGAAMCAMGDLACDMAYCAYTYCKKEGGTAAYSDCKGWHPVWGMTAASGNNHKASRRRRKNSQEAKTSSRRRRKSSQM